MNNDNDMLATQKIKYIIAVILAVVVGVVFAISTKNIRTFGAALIIAAYFGMQLFETIQNEKKGKYRKITALAVSADESRSGLGTVETWRFIPVDENGEYIDTNGRLDIFLQVKPKERNYHIGGTYNLLFCADENDTLTQDNLVSVEQKVVQASAQKGVSNTETKTGAKLIHLDMARAASEQEVMIRRARGMMRNESPHHGPAVYYVLYTQLPGYESATLLNGYYVHGKALPPS